MAETARREATVATSRERLAALLAEWPNAEDSWALVLISVVPTAGELAAIREAARVCDRVVAARLTPDRVAPPNLAATVREAGADVLYLPAAVSGRLEVRLAGEAVEAAVVTLLVQALTTVLPTVVVVSRRDVLPVRLIRGVQLSLGDFFSLRFVD